MHVTFVAASLVKDKCLGAVLHGRGKDRVRIQALTAPRPTEYCGVTVAVLKRREEEWCTLARFVHERIFILQVLGPGMAGKWPVRERQVCFVIAAQPDLTDVVLLPGEHRQVCRYRAPFLLEQSCLCRITEDVLN